MMRAFFRYRAVAALGISINSTPGIAFGQEGGTPASLTVPDQVEVAAPTAWPNTPTQPAHMMKPSPIPWYDDVGTRTKLFLSATVAGVAIYGATKWWEKGLSTDFRVHSEGWFGADTPKGGADKLGHAFGTYTGVRAGAHVLELLGNNPDDALRLAMVTSLAVYTGVEVLDGFTKTYRFSKEDVIANVAGAALGWVMQKNPKLDALFDFRLYYRQSPEAKAQGRWEPFDDYNGQKYLLAFKGSGVRALQANPVLRYVELAVGYGVRGYDPPGVSKSRHLYAGIGLNVSQVLDDTVFRGKRDTAVRNSTGLFLELFQLPGTVVLANHSL